MTNKKNRTNRRVTSVTRLRKKRQLRKRYRRIQQVSACILAVCTVVLIAAVVIRLNADSRHHKVQKEIKQIKEETITQNEEKDSFEIVMLPEYEALYEQNSDIIGWLSIDGTVIDYPVMQTMEDEDYYLSYDFNKEANSNGCLIMDTDATVGVGTAEHQYMGGTKPSTNLIIHGHTMKSGMMFGGLKQYAEESYGREHAVISFDSLYEKREYELIAVFYSQVYMNTDEVFKYYKFFQADTQEEFDDWYENIKSMSLYDTGISAEFGDEFITLSCCSYHTEDGRFVVVGKRIC